MSVSDVANTLLIIGAGIAAFLYAKPAVAVRVQNVDRPNPAPITHLPEVPPRRVPISTRSPEGFDYGERARPYLPIARAADEAHGLPPGTMASLLYQESRYRSDIINLELKSSAGAEGIAQIVPRWHPGVDTSNPAESIDYAAGYVRRLLNQFGTLDLALAAYNWGPGNLRKHGFENRPRETRDYVTQITQRIA